MYTKKPYLDVTKEVMQRLKYEVIFNFECPMVKIPTITGVSYGCLKHLCYDEAVNSSTRYDRLIRLLAGKYLPKSVLIEDGLLQEPLLNALVAFCVSPIQQAADSKMKLSKLTETEKSWFPSWSQVRRIAKGQIPLLDFVVRFLMGKTISVDTLVPPLYGTNSYGEYVCLLPDGLTEENTQAFFNALKSILTLT